MPWAPTPTRAAAVTGASELGLGLSSSGIKTLVVRTFKKKKKSASQPHSHFSSSIVLPLPARGFLFQILFCSVCSSPDPALQALFISLIAPPALHAECPSLYFRSSSALLCLWLCSPYSSLNSRIFILQFLLHLQVWCQSFRQAEVFYFSSTIRISLPESESRPHDLYKCLNQSPAPLSLKFISLLALPLLLSPCIQVQLLTDQNRIFSSGQL